MASYRIEHTRAGRFHKGQIVDKDTIEASGAKLDFWLRIGAVTPVQVIDKKDEEEKEQFVPVTPQEITDPRAAAATAQATAQQASAQQLAKQAQEAARKKQEEDKRKKEEDERKKQEAANGQQ